MFGHVEMLKTKSKLTFSLPLSLHSSARWNGKKSFREDHTEKKEQARREKKVLIRKKGWDRVNNTHESNKQDFLLSDFTSDFFWRNARNKL